jgi:hypothetical protein
MGANVIVTEVDPTKRARGRDGRLPRHAHGRGGPRGGRLHHGHRQQARPARGALQGDEGRAIIANSGHFNVEIDIPALAG